MGKSSQVTVGYWYTMGLHMGECYGPVDAMLEVRVGDRTAWQGNLTSSGSIYIYAPNLFGGEKQEGGIAGYLQVMMGEPTQVAPGYLLLHLGAPQPAGRGLLTTLFVGDVGAMNKYVKPWKKKFGRWLKGWNTPVWEPALCRIDAGMNPAHILYQVITDPFCGGRDPSVLDADRMKDAAQRLFNEGFGLCLKWARSTQIAEFIQLVCDHVGGMLVEDPFTGKQYLKLLRADYAVAELPSVDESNITALKSFQQSTLAETTNQVTVKYHDPATNTDASITATNPANVQAQGRVIAQQSDYPGLWNGNLAARIAQRDCQAASSLLCKIVLKVKSALPAQGGLWGVRKGDVLAFSWKRKGITRMPIRVLEADYGTVADNAITLTCVQDVFGLPLTSYVALPVPGWVPPDLSPQPVPAQVIEEASYRDLVSYLRPGDLAVLPSDAGYVTTLGARPTSVAYNYTVMTRAIAGGAFGEVGSGNFAPTGTLVAAIGPADTVVTLAGGRDLDQVVVGSEARLEGEVLRVTAIQAETATVTLARGCVDTVPVAHPIGARLWFADPFTGYDRTEYSTGETIEVKLLTRTGMGELDMALAPVGSVQLHRRQVRPYPPGNLRVRGDRYPAFVEGALVLAWSHRDRLLQADQLIDTLQGDIGPEPGTTYGVRVYLGTVLDSTTSGVAANTLTLSLSGDGAVRVEITAVRDGLTSWQSLPARFDYLRGERRLTEDSDERITEDGVLRIAES